ncbi:shikimate kinase [Rhodovulum sp. DZ06]|uniref:shikimate kinase n=1 Tax=Rhodovulum sp. DZ06 TaxID=3425126 RepID=UPI003D325B70
MTSEQAPGAAQETAAEAAAAAAGDADPAPIPRRRLLRPVVLVGLMGCGKSSVGRRLADALGAPFVDSDDEVEAAAAMTIPEIFESMGEPAFREGERRVIARLIEAGPRVIATGGGAFMNDLTRALVKERAASVWLRAELDTLVERTSRRANRPLLSRGDPREILAELMRVRYPVYAEADVCVESRPNDRHEEVAARIIAGLDAHGGCLAPPE